MKIIKHGKKPEPVDTTKRFRCLVCGCVFEADAGEYITFPDDGSLYWRGIKLKTDCACDCPECGGGAEEVTMR